ncbi:MAG TPA: fumarylacetoacetate hydrolase family protein [Blastocatellia bacterium]|nr:fumarylacetoacetate hydrolase family protein [Blastocatellia bacterium]
MKLLSMKIDGRDRAGILIGEEALDVTAFSEISERSGNELAGPLADALDLYLAGIERLKEITSRFNSDAALADEYRRAGAMRSLSEIKLNPPILTPGKILAVGLNYAAHAAEQNKKPPEMPLIFSKCVTALSAPDDLIRLPRISDQIDYEAELALVIGKEARSVSASVAFDYVAGYMIMNDVTARDLQQNEKQWTRAKGLDTFAPCGPWLVTADEINNPHSLDIQLSVNGEARQSSNTNDLIFKIPQLIEFISQDLTLRPGDIISTGTPSGVGVYSNPPIFLKDGDQIEINIACIGTLRNSVKGNTD